MAGDGSPAPRALTPRQALALTSADMDPTTGDMTGFDFTDRVVFVTGGTKGVGRGIASAFAGAGATVAVAARSAVDDLPADWVFESADLRDGESAMQLVDRIVERCGRIDVVINNAGGSPPADTSTVSPRFSLRIVELNLLSAIYVSQRANHHMQSGDGGSIVNIGSVTALRPAPTVAAYGAAKAGLLNYTSTTGQEWAPKVRVNCVTAGLIRTEQSEMHYGDAESVARIESTIPMQRMASPDDIAGTCMFLSSPMASYVTGANIVLDGGGDRPDFLSHRDDN
jgi:NAD(P)-dependent dehydrogenase (short-subunit alcohol dehydrogenase family)